MRNTMYVNQTQTNYGSQHSASMTLDTRQRKHVDLLSSAKSGSLCEFMSLDVTKRGSSEAIAGVCLT
eukprot:m.197859 g.197859  ORF g.197859 m.197859 type:complete len:67 (-) comp14911_c0_seq36:3235-3435(-)